MSARFLAGLVLAVALGACSVNSIDSVKEKQLNLCSAIKDEQVRANCIIGVGRAK